MDDVQPRVTVAWPDRTSIVDDGSEGRAYSDEELAREARQRPAAFGELYRRHLQKVYRYLLVRVGNVQDAQDLTSQTFLAALEGIGRYDGRGHFAAWLLGIARHKLVDYFRRDSAPLPLEAAGQMSHPAEGLEEAVERQLRVERLALALRALAPDRAEALTLRLFGRLAPAEVAQVMGKSEAAVRMLIHRAVRDLQDRLAPITDMEVEDER